MNNDSKQLEELVLDPDLETLEGQIGRFNLFEALRVVQQEIRHSAFLAYLLDPNESHGLSDSFAIRLLQRAVTAEAKAAPSVTAVDLDAEGLKDALVFTEREGIDILLVDDHLRLTVVLENKIGTGEHSDQLKRYRVQAGRWYPNHRFLGILLTPVGTDPTDPHYVPMSYATVADELKHLLQTRGSSIGIEIRIAIEHYMTVVRRHIVGEPEIERLCSKIIAKHRSTLELLQQYMGTQAGPVRRILEQLIDASPDRVRKDDCNNTYIRFVPCEWDTAALKHADNWTTTLRIVLIELVHEHDMVRLKIMLGPGPQAVREKVFKAALAHQPPFKCSMKTLGKMWNTIYIAPFCVLHPDWTEEELSAHLKESWTDFVSKELALFVNALRPATLT